MPGGKRSKQSGSDGEAEDTLDVIIVDSPDRASDALLALEGAAQEAPKEPYASLEDGIPDKGPPDADRAMEEAPLEIVVELPFSAKLANATPLRLKGPGRSVLNSPVIPMKWERPSSATPVPSPDTA